MSGISLGIMAIGSMGSAAAGMAANANRKGPTQNIIYPSQPSYNDTRQRLQSDWITQGFNRMNAGQMPAWYEGISPLLRKQQQTSLNAAYYGDPMQTGIYDQTKSYDASRGLGGGGAASKTYGSQQQKYAQQNKQISDYISQLGYNAMQSDTQTLPQQSNALSADIRGWNTPVGMYTTPAQPNNWDSVSKAFGMMGSMAPYMSGMGGGTTGGGGSGYSETPSWMDMNNYNPYGMSGGMSSGSNYMDNMGFNFGGSPVGVGSYNGSYGGGQLQPWAQTGMNMMNNIPNYLAGNQGVNWGDNAGQNVANRIRNSLYQS